MKMLWTREEEERLRKLLQGNARPDEIATALNRSISAVKSKAHATVMTIAQLGSQRRSGLSRGAEGEEMSTERMQELEDMAAFSNCTQNAAGSRSPESAGRAGQISLPNIRAANQPLNRRMIK